MSAIQQIRDSGLFDEYPLPPSGGNVRFEVIGWPRASIWANDHEIHIRETAFTAHGRGRFSGRINDTLHEFVRTRSHGFYRSGYNRAYILDGEHTLGVIELIRAGT